MQIEENPIEEIHRRMELQLTYRHEDYIIMWKELRKLTNDLGDALYPSKSKCPICGSLETRTSLDKYNRDSGEKVYLKVCDACDHSWLTTELK